MMTKRIIPFLIISLILVFNAGCASKTKKEIEDADLVSASYNAADALLKELAYHQRENKTKMAYLHPTKPILIASFVNIDNVQTSSTFGRMIAEQVGSRISQNGYKVKEIKLRNSVFVQEQMGEMLLSREILDISNYYNAHSVVVGTYAVGKNTVYVTAKLISAKNNVILASYDYSLPIGANTQRLLKTKRRY